MAKPDAEHEIYMHSMLDAIRDEPAEKRVLGTILAIKDSYYSHADRIFEDLFYTIEYKIIFKAIRITAEAGKQIDMVSVMTVIREYQLDYFNGSKVGLLPILTRLTDFASYTFGIDEHLSALEKVYQRRRIIELAFETKRKCESLDEPDDVISYIGAEIVALKGMNEKDFNHRDAIYETVNEINDTEAKDFIKSGIKPLDDFIFGFQLSDQIVIGGAPSMGKTAFALRLFRNFMHAGFCPAYFSLEMSKSQLISRMISSDGFIPLGAIRRKSLSVNQKTKMSDVAAKLMEQQFMIDDKKIGTLNSILNKIRKYVIKYGTKVVIIDYLQLVSVNLGKNSNREQEIATISRSFKELARDLNIVMIVLSQLSREVSKRHGSKRPMLSDLRESGAIEQDADFVLFPYRPAYYNTLEKVPAKEDAEVIVAKGRGTGVEIVNVKFMSAFTKYLNNYDEEKVDEEIQQAQGDSDTDF